MESLKALYEEVWKSKSLLFFYFSAAQLSQNAIFEAIFQKFIKIFSMCASFVARYTIKRYSIISQELPNTSIVMIVKQLIFLYLRWFVLFIFSM